MLTLISVIDSLNATFVGAYAYGIAPVSPYTQLVAPDRRLAFVPFGGAVEVMDVSNPYEPLKLSTIHTRGTVLSAKLYGDRLYVATGRFGYEVWDVSDPLHPTRVSLWNSPCGVAKDIALHRGYVLLSSTCGLTVFDSSLSPVFTYPSPISTVHLYGDTAVAITDLTSGGDTLIALDLSDPSSPTVLAKVPVRDVLSSASYGNYLYLSYSYGGLEAYDIGTLSRTYGVLLTPYGSMEAGNGLLVGAYRYDGNLDFINLSDPAVPSLDSTVAFDTTVVGMGFAVDLLGDTVFLFGIVDSVRRLAILKGSIRLATYNPAIPMSSITFSGSHLYYIGYPDSLCILDVSDPHIVRRERCIAGFRTGLPGNLMALDTLLFLPGDTLKIYSIADPLNPTFLSSLPIGGTWLAAKDTLLLLSSSSSAYVISVADPSAPYLLSTLPAGGPLSVRGNLLAVGDALYDITDPSAPTFLSSLGLSNVRDAYLYDTLLFVGVASDMVKVYDVSDPSSPVHVSDISGTYVDGAYDYVFVLGSPGGYVRAYRASTLDLLGYYSYQANLNGFLETAATDPIKLHDGHIYALFRMAGIHAFRFRLPLSVSSRPVEGPGGCSSYYDVSGRRVEPRGRGAYFCVGKGRVEKVVIVR